MEFRKDINGLRALAVLLVLLFHFGAPGFGAGFIGVDVFFVISGFLMTGIIASGLEKRSFSIFGFYRARLVRLYPALVAVVAATLLFGLVFVEPGALKDVARDGISALAFVSNIVFWQEAGYFGASADTMWMLHTWSLSVEWQFYLIYPVVLALAFPLLPGRQSRFALLLLGFILSLALSVVLGTVFDNGRLVSAGFYMLPPRAWEMLAGGLVALWPWRMARVTQSSAALCEIMGVAAILSSLMLFSEDTAWPSYSALLPVAGTMLVLAARSPRSILASTPLQAIGTWSYSIYLWHWPLVAALAYFRISGAGVESVAFMASILLGWASYTFIEQPCRVLLKGMAATNHRERAAGMASLGIITLAVVAGGAAMVLGGGLPQRNKAVAAVYGPSLEAVADYTFPLDHCGGTSTFGKTLRQCGLGNPSSEADVLVIGDSFAEIWYARVEELMPALDKHAVVFITKGGCPPLPGLERTAPGFGCSSFHQRVMEQARSSRYKRVIFAGMWTSYFKTNKATSLVCGENGGCLSAATKAGLDLAINNLAGEIDELRALGKDVVLLTTSPYPDFDVPAELRRRIFAGDPPAADWTFDFRPMEAQSQPIDSALKTLGGHGAHVVDLLQLLCDDAICPLTRGNVPFYKDASHLRSNYTASVGTFLDPFIR